MLIRIVACLAILCTFQETAPEPEPVKLVYGWPDSGSVCVVEEVQKRGQKATTSYVLHWTPTEEGDGFWLEHDDFEFVAIEGVDIDHPVVRAQLEEAKTLSEAIPRYRVDKEGAVVAIEGLDEMIERLRKSVCKDMGEDAWNEFKDIFDNPVMQQLLYDKIAERWGIWVSTWRGVEVVRGTEEVWEFDLEEAQSVCASWTVQFGEREKYRGLDCVEIATHGEADEAVMLKMVQEMFGASEAGKKLFEDQPMPRASREDSIRGIYAVDGLRPLEVHTEMHMKVWAGEGTEPMERVETHTYYFDWDDLDPE